MVAAHPDDEVLGCGGTIARLSGEGHEVYVALLGEGATSRYPRREDANQCVLEALRDSALRAAECLGVRRVFFYQLPDNLFDTVPLLDIVKTVEDVVASVRPDVIFTHHAGDLNVDHNIVHRAVVTATRPVAGQTVKEVFTFEVPSSTEWSFHQFSRCFTPNFFVSIEGTLDAKLVALSYYAVEIRPFPHPRSPEAITALARRWGTAVGCEAAEAFELIRAFRAEGDSGSGLLLTGR